MDHWDRTRQDGPLTIRMEQAGDVLVVRVFGELGRSTAETFEFELRVAISGDASTVVLDLGGLGSIDSTGLRSVVRIANQSLRAGRRLRMRRPPASVREALEGSGLEHLLPSVD
jgi:anti-anti-sigma factor